MPPRINLTMTADSLAQLERLCEKYQQTPSAMVRLLVAWQSYTEAKDESR